MSGFANRQKKQTKDKCWVELTLVGRANTNISVSRLQISQRSLYSNCNNKHMIHVNILQTANNTLCPQKVSKMFFSAVTCN